MIKGFLFVLFKLSHMALQHGLSSLVWTGCALPCTAITSNHSKKFMWIFWCTYTKAHITVTPSREASWCFGSPSQNFKTALSSSSKYLEEGGQVLLLGYEFGGVSSFSKLKHQNRVHESIKNGQGYAADNLRKIYQESKTFLMKLQVLMNTGRT